MSSLRKETSSTPPPRSNRYLNSNATATAAARSSFVQHQSNGLARGTLTHTAAQANGQSQQRLVNGSGVSHTTHNGVSVRNHAAAAIGAVYAPAAVYPANVYSRTIPAAAWHAAPAAPPSAAFGLGLARLRHFGALSNGAGVSAVAAGGGGRSYRPGATIGYPYEVVAPPFQPRQTTEVRKRRNSLLTEVRLAKNMWTHTEKLGYALSEPVPENKVTWGFTYMNRRHFVEFLQRGERGQIHSISLDERMIEKVEVDKSMGFGPANYRIYLSGTANDERDGAASGDSAPGGANGGDKSGGNDTTGHGGNHGHGHVHGHGRGHGIQRSKSASPRVTARSPQSNRTTQQARFPCVITLAVNDQGHTTFTFSIDGMPYEVARSRWIVDYTRKCSPDSSLWRRVCENTEKLNPNSMDEEVHKTWTFAYKKHTHKVKFFHSTYKCQWDLTVDGQHASLLTPAEGVFVPDPSLASTPPGRVTPISFSVAGLPCHVLITKNNFIYYYDMEIDGTPVKVFNELVSYFPPPVAVAAAAGTGGGNDESPELPSLTANGFGNASAGDSDDSQSPEFTTGGGANEQAADNREAKTNGVGENSRHRGVVGNRRSPPAATTATYAGVTSPLPPEFALRASTPPVLNRRGGGGGGNSALAGNTRTPAAAAATAAGMARRIRRSQTPNGNRSSSPWLTRQQQQQQIGGGGNRGPLYMMNHTGGGNTSAVRGSGGNRLTAGKNGDGNTAYPGFRPTGGK